MIRLAIKYSVHFAIIILMMQTTMHQAAADETTADDEIFVVEETSAGDAAQYLAPEDWTFPQLTHRLTVELLIPPQPDSEDWTKFASDRTSTPTAAIEINYESQLQDAHENVRVTTIDGKAVACVVYDLGQPGMLIVKFPVSSGSTAYHIYYGDTQEALPARPGGWRPATNVLGLTTLSYTTSFEFDAITPERALDQFKTLLKSATLRHQQVYLNQVSFDKTPTGLAESIRYISSVEGIFRADLTGRYQFSADTGGTGVLLINGKPMCLNIGREKPAREWPSPAEIHLEQGYHHIRLLLLQTHNRQGFRIGWIRPGTTAFELMPREVFTRDIFPEPRRLDTLDNSTGQILPIVSMAFENANVAYRLDDQTVLPVRLINVSNLQGDIRYEWEVNGRIIPKKNPTVPLKNEEEHSIILRAFRNNKLVGEFARKRRASESTERPALLNLQLTSAPYIVIRGETENLSFHMHSNFAGMMMLDIDSIVTTVSDSKPKTISHNTFTLGAAQFGTCLLSVPIHTTRFQGDNQIEIRVRIAGSTATSQTFRVVPVGPSVQSLRASSGRLIDTEGRRAIIITNPVDVASFRKWAIPRAIGRMLSSRQKSILLYGDAMEYQPSTNTPFTGYVQRLRRNSINHGHSFDFAARVDSTTGIMADLPRFANVLADRNPTVVVISPGLTDILNSVPVRNFERSLQIMIDLIRAKDRETTIILVPPPPFASNPTLSQRYSRAMADIAHLNRVRFADIHTGLMSVTEWMRLYRSAPDDAVYYTYPNSDGHIIMSDLIFRFLR